eukprot:TRINITY_DN11293_c0_g1_i2.p1 TRINITY_DN11293_c0_g1~~TRINITY_DN11293_c0_g1_i2.p1  ORF type:complete len:698 (+),score=153.16 TRINITY_DN11293_c0_g1_i2:55-2148(+)
MAAGCEGSGGESVASQLPPHLQFQKKLGHGAYGSVYLCECRRTGEEVAVKHIKDAHRGGKSTLRELVLLARLRHENLVYLLDFPAVPTPDVRDVFLVLPYMHTDLHKVIKSGQELTEKHVQAVTCQILRGLAHLHAAGVAHRDLKPGNVLLSKDCKARIADFGLARGDMPEVEDDVGQLEPILTEYVVTRWYRAPEIMLLPQRYTPAVDLWSVGCILGEMLKRKPLFPGRNHVDMIKLYGEIRGSPQPEDVDWVPRPSEAWELLQRCCPPSRTSQMASAIPTASRPCLDLLHGLLSWDPTSRPTASEAQEHEYLRRYLPKTAAKEPEVFDWSFDRFRATSQRVQERLYAECARLHPEIVDRDFEELCARGFFERMPEALDSCACPREPLREKTAAMRRSRTPPPQGRNAERSVQRSGATPPVATSSSSRSVGAAQRLLLPQSRSTTPSPRCRDPRERSDATSSSNKKRSDDDLQSAAACGGRQLSGGPPSARPAAGGAAYVPTPCRSLSAGRAASAVDIFAASNVAARRRAAFAKGDELSAADIRGVAASKSPASSSSSKSSHSRRGASQAQQPLATPAADVEAPPRLVTPAPTPPSGRREACGAVVPGEELSACPSAWSRDLQAANADAATPAQGGRTKQGSAGQAGYVSSTVHRGKVDILQEADPKRQRGANARATAAGCEASRGCRGVCCETRA